jgi:hypothetical protein
MWTFLLTTVTLTLLETQERNGSEWNEFPITFRLVLFSHETFGSQC